MKLVGSLAWRVLHPGARVPEELRFWGHGRMGAAKRWHLVGTKPESEQGGTGAWQVSPGEMPQLQPSYLCFLPLETHSPTLWHTKPGAVSVHYRSC